MARKALWPLPSRIERKHYYLPSSFVPGTLPPALGPSWPSSSSFVLVIELYYKLPLGRKDAWIDTGMDGHPPGSSIVATLRTTSTS